MIQHPGLLEMVVTGENKATTVAATTTSHDKPCIIAQGHPYLNLPTICDTYKQLFSRVNIVTYLTALPL